MSVYYNSTGPWSINRGREATVKHNLTPRKGGKGRGEGGWLLYEKCT